MTRFPKKSTGLYTFLKQAGALDPGNKQLIAAKKKEYYLAKDRAYKKQRRKEYPEVTVSLSKSQHKILSKHAATHHLTLASFLREATLAYVQQSFLVPNVDQVSSVEQRLRQVQTDIHQVAKHLKLFQAEELSQVYLALEERFYRLEQVVSQRLRNPDRLEPILIEKLRTNPKLLANIRTIISAYDS